MFSYQKDAVEWMEIREQDKKVPGGFLCHEMGLGKTHIMSALIDSRSGGGSTLLLTTKSTIGAWADTLRLYSNFKYDVRVYKKGMVLRRDTVVVATHQSVFNTDEWYRAQKFVRFVVDEAHVMRNKNNIFNKFLEIAKTTKYRWGITATPFNNRDADMNAYMEFLSPNKILVGAAFKYYFLRKLRSDVVKGGPKLLFKKMVYDFEFPEERMLYDYVSEKIDDAHNWIVRNARIIPWRQRGQMMLTLLIRKRQAAIHPQLVLNAEKVWAEEAGGEVGDWDGTKVTKFNKISEMVVADQLAGKSTMIVTHFKCELELIRAKIPADVPVLILTGKTSTKTRREMEGYNGPPAVLLLQIQAGGVGVSFPWIHHVINTSPDWNPFLEKQSIYRAYRINTPHDVVVTSMYFRDTIDIDIQERQRTKMENSLLWLGDPLSSISDFVRMP
jgi:SNF2 family DNA or RNA helicase